MTGLKLTVCEDEQPKPSYLTKKIEAFMKMVAESY
jgi:hypothetical protein